MNKAMALASGDGSREDKRIKISPYGYTNFLKKS